MSAVPFGPECPQTEVPTRHMLQREVADRFRVSKRTLERWRAEGVGPKWLRLNGRIVYRAVDIEAFEAAHMNGSGH